MKKKLVALLSSLALLGGTAQGMLSANAIADTENNTNPYVDFDYESYREKSYYFNSDGVIYYQGSYPVLGKDCYDNSSFDIWIRAPKVVDFSDAIQEIMQTEDPSAKLAVIISPECLEHVAFEKECAQYAREHTLKGMTYEEIILDLQAFEKEISQFEEDNWRLCHNLSNKEIEALFFQETTGQPTWNKPWTIEDYSNIYKEIQDYSFQLAEEEIAKESERLEFLDFEIQEAPGIQAIVTVEQLQNFIPSDRLGYTIRLQFLAPTSENSNTSNIFPVEVKTVISGDTNDDGEIGVVDTIVLQKWLLGVGELPNWKNADLCEDGVINIYDLLKLKQMLIA
ncbi:MAG: dockerin type I repeat-containing protein [Oscillospiraceae bacterium]|nr:dockerin type I repeat-containing protein [Oscillospiraceae bacterium]